jgi:hypothetical protein
LKDQRFEVFRADAEALLLGISKLAGDKDVPDEDLEEAVVEHVAASLYWTSADARPHGGTDG